MDRRDCFLHLCTALIILDAPSGNPGLGLSVNRSFSVPPPDFAAYLAFLLLFPPSFLVKKLGDRGFFLTGFFPSPPSSVSVFRFSLYLVLNFIEARIPFEPIFFFALFLDVKLQGLFSTGLFSVFHPTSQTLGTNECFLVF